MRKLLVLLAFAVPAVASSATGAPTASTVTELRTRGPVLALAADGDRAAFVFSNRHRPGVFLWDRARHRVVKFRAVLAGGDCLCAMRGVALAGTRVGWLEAAVGMTFSETTVGTATVARPAPVRIAFASGSAFGESGDTALAPIGDGRLLVFTVERRCAAEGGDGPPCPPGRKAGDVIEATLWRTPARGRCPGDDAARNRCARVAAANGRMTALAVDAGRIAARTDTGVTLLAAGGAHLSDITVANVRAAALSGDRLALRVPGSVQVYDAGSGELVKTFSVEGGVRLEDLDHGILVLAAQGRVTLRRLSDGRTATIHLPGRALAQLEQPGLFVAAGHRVTFRPTREVARMLDSQGAQMYSRGAGPLAVVPQRLVEARS
jgi:hypothetical protein